MHPRWRHRVVSRLVMGHIFWEMGPRWYRRWMPLLLDGRHIKPRRDRGLPL